MKGWDGTFNGKPVAQGVYFVNVKATGADGKNFHIKKDREFIARIQRNNYTNALIVVLQTN